MTISPTKTRICDKSSVRPWSGLLAKDADFFTPMTPQDTVNPKASLFLKVIACEIAVREFYYAASRTQNLVDLEFLTQGYHDTPAKGRAELQKRIDAVPPGKYDAILLGYGLCSNILAGITATHTPLVVPRAHDCITFFLGSKERYQECFTARPGTYYYTSGWLECAKRRAEKSPFLGGASVPATLNLNGNYEDWVKKYGEDQAKYLLEEMSRWSNSYSHGTLIGLDFLKHLDFRKQVQAICTDKNWTFDELHGDLGLLQRFVDGVWPTQDFLVIQPGQRITASFDQRRYFSGVYEVVRELSAGLKAQQQLPDIHVAEGVDVLPNLRTSSGLPVISGNSLTPLFPRETNPGPHPRLRAAGHAIQLLPGRNRTAGVSHGGVATGTVVAARRIDAVFAGRFAS